MTNPSLGLPGQLATTGHLRSTTSYSAPVNSADQPATNTPVNLDDLPATARWSTHLTGRPQQLNRFSTCEPVNPIDQPGTACRSTYLTGQPRQPNRFSTCEPVNLVDRPGSTINQSTGHSKTTSLDLGGHPKTTFGAQAVRTTFLSTNTRKTTYSRVKTTSRGQRKTTSPGHPKTTCEVKRRRPLTHRLRGRPSETHKSGRRPPTAAKTTFEI